MPSTLTPQAEVAALVEQIQSYAEAERKLVDQARGRLTQLKSEDCAIVLWGMATKGILFSFLVDPDCRLLDFCIDINPNKQGCFVPVTGHAISSVEALPRDSAQRLAVVVMNTNYLAEVAATCRSRGLNPLFLNASGELLTPPTGTI